MTRRTSTPVRVTRQRRSASTVKRAARPVRDPGIEELGFTCFRLVPTGDDEAPYYPLRLHETRNAMGAFAFR